MQKPHIDENVIIDFLDGQGSYAGMEHVRYIDAPSWSNKAKVVIRKPDDTISVKEIAYTPFIWSKQIDFTKYYCWRYIEVPVNEYNEEHQSFIYDDVVHKIDEKYIINEGLCKENEDVYVIKMFLDTIEKRKAYFKEKAKEYNIRFKKLTTSYDKEETDRMRDGYKFQIKIYPHPLDPQNPYHIHCSSNPNFKYRENKKQKITGSFRDLTLFLKEGGIDIYEKNGTFLSHDKLQNYTDNKDLINLYFDTITPFKNKAGHIDIFSEFWVNQLDAEKCYEYIKSKEEWIEKFKLYYNRQPLDFTNIWFDKTPLSQCDLINYEGEKRKVVGDVSTAYISPKESKHVNAFSFMEGFISLGENFDTIKPHLLYDIKVLCRAIKEFVPKSVIFDEASYKKLWGKHYNEIKEWIILEFSKITFDYSPPKSLTKTRVFDYIDIIGKQDFIDAAINDDRIKDFLLPEINLGFVDGLTKKKQNEIFSLHTSKYGRVFIDICKEKGYDILDEVNTQFQIVAPISQFMYETGIRVFKGYEYNDTKRLVIDIETKALPEFEYDKKAALYPEKGWIFTIGIYGNYGYQKILTAENPKEEKKMIVEAYRIIASENPDILIGYNSEWFDFPYMEKRLEMLGGVAEDKYGNIGSIQYIREIIKKEFDVHYPDVYISPRQYYSKKDTTVKVGGETKDTKQTQIFGMNIMDGIHQTWKAMAVNKDIEKAGLKWNITYNKIGKKNRVYVEGDKIGHTKEIKECYFNNDNGDWFDKQKEYVFEKNIYDPKYIKVDDKGKKFYGNKDYLYFFTSDSKDDAIKGCSNSFEILVLDKKGKAISDIYNQHFTTYLSGRFSELKDRAKKYNKFIIPMGRNGVSFDKSSKNYESLLSFLKSVVGACNDVKQFYGGLDGYETVSGAYIVERYLIDDLWETDVLFEKYAQSSFMLAKWGHNNFERLASMGYASIWKIIISCWNYLHGIAIPEYDEPREINGGLIGMIKSGFVENVVKYDYSSLYPATKDAHIPPSVVDISEVCDWLLRFFLYTRLKYKGMAGQHEANGEYDKASMYDVLQLPLKIFINSYYGFLGANFVSTLADMIIANFITANSRMLARHSINYMMREYNFVPIYCHTDGINFSFGNVDNEKYVGKGINWLVEKGKEYTGLKAIVAKYNDTFFPKGRMGMGIDDIDRSCINIAKSNVVHYKTVNKDGKIFYVPKITGGLIKKDTPEYIKNFIEGCDGETGAAEMILQNRPVDFLDMYCGYIRKIWRHGIKAKDIASKVRLKSTDEYLNNAKVKSAPYELIIKNNIDVSPGDYFYWVNNGEKTESPDFTIEKKVIGRFILDEKNYLLYESMMKYSTKDEIDNIKELIMSYHEQGMFVFSKNRIDGKMVENISALDHFKAGSIKDIKLNYKEKKTKKETKVLLEVLTHIEHFNSKWVSVDDYEATVEYNQKKYLHKFNKAIEPLFIVFHPDIRERIIMNEPNENGEFVLPDFNEQDLKLVSGFPLEGKEHNQQDFEELMEVQEIERKFWRDVRKDPNWFLTEKELLVDEYSIIGKKYIEGSEQNADVIVNLKGVVDHLANNLMVDKI